LQIVEDVIVRSIPDDFSWDLNDLAVLGEDRGKDFPKHWEGEGNFGQHVHSDVSATWSLLKYYKT
jgi:hypothetical protein